MFLLLHRKALNLAELSIEPVIKTSHQFLAHMLISIGYYKRLYLKKEFPISISILSIQHRVVFQFY